MAEAFLGQGDRTPKIPKGDETRERKEEANVPPPHHQEGSGCWEEGEEVNVAFPAHSHTRAEEAAQLRAQTLLEQS